MAYEFPSDIQDRLQARLNNGFYQSEDEVIRAAMDALDQEKLIRWDERNQLVMEQSRQGLSAPLDDVQVLARLRERLVREGILE